MCKLISCTIMRVIKSRSKHPRGGGGNLGIFHGTGTCHFFRCTFLNSCGIMGIIFTIFRHLTELWVSFSGDFS